MSKRQELGKLVGYYLVAWAIFVGLSLNTPVIPTMIGEWFAVGISVAFVAFLVYMYKPQKRRRHQRIDKKNAQVLREVRRFLLFNRIMLVFACIWEVWSLYNLYTIGYFSGAYNALSEALRLLNYTRPIPSISSTFYRAVSISLVGVVTGIIGIALPMYSHGLVRGLQAKRRLR